VTFHRAGAVIETLTADQTLDGSPTLPGFLCTVSEIFAIVSC
jgi:hypothetical protein